MSKELIKFESDPYSLFIFAINSPSTKEKYVPRLNKFLEFINLKGTIHPDGFRLSKLEATTSIRFYLRKNLRYLKKPVGIKDILRTFSYSDFYSVTIH